jgi:hypothetical protein
MCCGDRASTGTPAAPALAAEAAVPRSFAPPSQGDVSAAWRRRPFHEYRTGGIGDLAELDARLAAGEQHACQRGDRTLARTVVVMGL